MKKTLSIMIMAAALLLMTQCRKDEMPAVMPETNTVRMTVTAGPGSKTDITPAGAIKWSDNDKIYVGHNGTYVGYLTLVSSAGSATGTFSGDVALTGITDGTEQTFHFYYLGSYNSVAPAVGATSVDVLFNEQNIYNDGGKLVNANKYHVGYGTASGTVKDGVVTGINVTLVSKVALARFSFKKGGADYTDALTLSGDKIYNSMTVGFNGSFNHGATPGNITLTGGYGERYVMLVPAGDATEQTLTFTGSSDEGEGKVPGLESNKFYGKTEPIAVTLTASAPTHEYVDLGLPSGLLWATCNLGASSPEEYGDYYAWGEILPYYADGHSQDSPCSTWRIMTTGAGNTTISNGYARETYSRGGSSSFDEWTTPPYDATTKILTSARDVATQNWGSAWRMPTETDFTELINNTTRTWYASGNTEFGGVAGWKCESYDKKYIFLPAAGYRSETSLKEAGSLGRCWSSSLSTSYPDNGHFLSFGPSDFYMDNYHRYLGFTVRPVCPPQN